MIRNTWTLRKVDQKHLDSFENEVLLKDGEDQLDRSCEKLRNMTKGLEKRTVNRRKGNWIGHMLRRNWLLRHVTEGKIEGRMGLTGRR